MCCRVLKRVPKASRIPVAEKLAGTLQQVLAHPEYVPNWIELFSSSLSCLGVPGHRGGKRHLSSLAFKVNQAIGNFPNATPPAAKHQRKPSQRRQQPNNLAARESNNIEHGDM
jgi:hypothetical protein